MRKLLSLLFIFICISRVSGKLVEVGINTGIVKCKVPVVKGGFAVYRDPKAPAALITSVSLLFLVPHSGFSIGAGVDMHNLDLVSTEDMPYFYSSGNPGYDIKTVPLAHPLLPLYLELRQCLARGPLVSLYAELYAGKIFAPGEHSEKNEYHFQPGAGIWAPEAKTKSGSGFVAGVGITGSLRVSKLLSLNLSFSPRYYNVRSSRSFSYYMQGNNNTTGNINVNGTVSTVYLYEYIEKMKYNTIAFPVLLGLSVNI